MKRILKIKDKKICACIVILLLASSISSPRVFALLTEQEKILLDLPTFSPFWVCSKPKDEKLTRAISNIFTLIMKGNTLKIKEMLPELKDKDTLASILISQYTGRAVRYIEILSWAPVTYNNMSGIILTSRIVSKYDDKKAYNYNITVFYTDSSQNVKFFPFGYLEEPVNISPGKDNTEPVDVKDDGRSPAN